MKKLIALLLCLLMAAGCSSGSSGLDTNGCIKALDEKYGNVEPIADSALENIYDLDLSIIEEHTIKCSNDQDGHFYAILKVSDDNKTEVKDDMKNMIDTIIIQNAMYKAEVTELFENYLEKEVGDYLIYIVSEDTADYYNVVKEYIK